MKRLAICISRLVVLPILGIGIAVSAQDADVTTRISTAASLTSLELADQKPWHLKLEVTVFDDEGTNASEGTIEVWHAGTDERTQYTFGAATEIAFRHDGKLYRTPSGPAVPVEAYEVVEQTLNPGPTAADITGSKPALRKEKLGKDSFDCIMLSQPIKGTGVVPLGLFPTYCIDDGGVIRASYNFGARTVLINSIGKFEDHDVPVRLEILNGQIKVGVTKVAALSTYAPTPQEFIPPADAKSSTGIARVAGGVIQGQRVSFVQPVYPQSMKSYRLGGTVILAALIGRDGRIHSLRPVNVTDPDFVIAAIAAVRRWRYKPYTLNGEPTEVQTTITVNFAMN